MRDDILETCQAFWPNKSWGVWVSGFAYKIAWDGNSVSIGFNDPIFDGPSPITMILAKIQSEMNRMLK